MKSKCEETVESIHCLESLSECFATAKHNQSSRDSSNVNALAFARKIKIVKDGPIYVSRFEHL